MGRERERKDGQGEKESRYIVMRGKVGCQARVEDEKERKREESEGCDACSRLFCKDHLLYDDHACSGKYKKDIQVPVCPLCSSPVPIARGAVPDLAVSAHIDQGCPAKNKKEMGEVRQGVLVKKR